MTQKSLQGNIQPKEMSELNTGYLRASLIAQLVSHLPAMQETRVLFLGQEDPLEEEMAPHSSILAWRIPWQRSVAGYSPRDRKSWTRLSD